MGTKYAGQTALNKLMQLIKTAMNNKADKTALDGKLDKTGGTVTGSLTVIGAGLSVEASANGSGNLSVDGPLVARGGFFVLNGEEYASLVCTGENAAKIVGTDSNYARVAVGAPSGGNDATTKDYVDTKVSGLQTASQVKAAINSALTGVYTPRGSIHFADLPQPQEGNKGYVYNVMNDFTTTSAFLEGEGRAYSAGTNVACVYAGSDNGYKWDVLASTIDLTELTADDVQTLWNSN